MKAILGKTPYEAQLGKKPKVMNLRIFGCLAYAYVLDTNRHKLEAKSRKCKLIGYSIESNAYKLYDAITRQVVMSRDIKFGEKPLHVKTFEWKGELLQIGNEELALKTPIKYQEKKKRRGLGYLLVIPKTSPTYFGDFQDYSGDITS